MTSWKNRIAAALSTMPTLCLANECALGRGHSFKMQPERKKNVMHQPTLLGNREQWGIICTATGLHFSTLLPPSFLTQWHPSHPQSCGCTEDPQTCDHQFLRGTTLYSQSLSQIEFLWQAFHTLEQFAAIHPSIQLSVLQITEAQFQRK